MPRVNTDEILRGFGDWRNPSDLAKAGKEAVKLLKELLQGDETFNQETTLCGKSIVSNIKKAKENGFRIEMHYVDLDSADIAKKRVAHRVSVGGHGIPEKDIEKRYVETQDMYDKFLDAVKKASIVATPEQKKALSLFYINTNDAGYISDINTDEARNIFFIDYFRKSSQTTELIILSCGDDSISKAEYDKYVALGKYDRVSVDWHKEATKDMCLEELFYNRTDIDELPPILKPLKELLDTHTEPFKYAWFGED